MLITETGKTYMKFLRRAGWTLLTLSGIYLVAVLVAMWVYRDIPAAQLEAKYGTEPSRYMNVAGARVHYRDEGPRDAPVIVLIHANWASLLGWEPWVEQLKDAYRVVRFDMTSHGLTGPDPTGDYTLERTIELTEKFVDGLGIDKFTIAGTSLGGTVSVFYTAKHPERVEHLVLLSPGSIEGKERKEGPRGSVPEAANILKYIMPKAIPKFFLTSGYADPETVPDELVERWYELWRLEGQREAQLARLRQYDSGDIAQVFGRVTVPVLLLWGEDNPVAKFEQHEEVIELLSNAESIDFISYPGVGHMAVQEAGEVTGIDVRRYLDGQLESGWRVSHAESAANGSDPL